MHSVGYRTVLGRRRGGTPRNQEPLEVIKAGHSPSSCCGAGVASDAVKTLRSDAAVRSADVRRGLQAIRLCLCKDELQCLIGVSTARRRRERI